MKYEDLELESYLIEKAILRENPYNWKKHFIHLLPEIIYFCFRWFAILLFIQIVFSSMALAVADVILNISLNNSL